MATIIRFKDLLANTNAEPPCEIFYGITKDTVPNASLVMGYTRSGPDMQNQRHYHPHSGAGQCKIKGNDTMLCGQTTTLLRSPSMKVISITSRREKFMAPSVLVRLTSWSLFIPA